jgi:uroporphyrinogen III methyltransferase/synthase
MAGVNIASIGPITEKTAKKFGFDVHIVAKSFTIKGLCEAICEHYNHTAAL